MKIKEHEEIIAANREGARLLDWDTKSLEHAITEFQDEWGSETFHTEVNGIPYKIAPVGESVTIDVSEFTTAAAEVKRGIASLKALSGVAYRNDDGADS